MRVRVKSISLENRNYYDLTIGNVYRVIDCSDEYIRVMSDLGKPYAFPIELFEVTDKSIPSDWVETTLDGIKSMSIKGLHERGFWERYFEHDREAKILFEVKLKKWMDGID